MPILDVTLVLQEVEELPDELTDRLAKSAPRAMDSEPAGTWVRLHTLASDRYADGDGGPATSVRPVFVPVLKATRPVEDERRRLPVGSLK